MNCPICKEKEFSLVASRFDSCPIVRCLSCGHIYINAILDEAITADIYERYYTYDREDAIIKTIEYWFLDPANIHQHALRLAMENIGLEGKTVLDVGCGVGRLLFECRKYGATIFGVEPNLAAVHLAKKHFGIELIAKTLDQAIKQGCILFSQFDIIFSLEVIEHINSPGVFLDSIFRLLKPGGLLIISTPNFGLFYLLGNSYAGVRQYKEHLHFYTPETLVSCLKRYNFEVVHLTTCSPLTYGDREKIILSSNPLVDIFWRRLRKVSFIYALKDAILALLARHKERADLQHLNGSCIACCCRKPRT